MKDEIKEILDKAKEISKYGDDGKQHTRMFNQFEAKALLDYITNLQEENKKLLEDKDSWHRVAQKNYNEMQDKIDKAIEYIEEFYDRNEEVIEAFNFEYSYKYIISLLQGKSDE